LALEEFVVALGALRGFFVNLKNPKVELLDQDLLEIPFGVKNAS